MAPNRTPYRASERGERLMGVRQTKKQLISQNARNEILDGLAFTASETMLTRPEGGMVLTHNKLFEEKDLLAYRDTG